MASFRCVVITCAHHFIFTILLQRLNAFSEFRHQHPDVFIDVSRGSTTIRLDGLADDVSEAKDALLAMGVKQESRSLTSIEASVVVGKKGVNINKLVDEHKVTIEVDHSGEEYTVSVIGPNSNVEKAMSAIDELLEANKDVTESVPINGIVRSVLLNNGGGGIKKLQKQVNEKIDEGDGTVFLSIDKNTKADDSMLLVKARRPALLVALEVVYEEVKEIMDAVVTIHIDSFIAPRLIGKGGANIKKLKNQGDGVIIEVDQAGKIQLYGSNEDVEAVKQTIQTVVDENQLERIDCDPSSIKLVYRALIREKHKEINETVPGCDLDDEKSQIVLRGSAEQVSAAASCTVA
jgi:rRNA processing protein Krr1/Pno1